MDITVPACIGFSIVALVCWLMVVLIRLGRFHRNGWLGVNTDATQSSDEAWETAHAAAAPWLLGAALSATAGALLCGGAVAVSTASNDGDVIGLLGLIVGSSGVIAFSFKAFTVANRAADPE